MRVGRLRSVEVQTELFEVDYLLGGTGATRSWVGDYFEELLAGLTGASRIRSDPGAEICPDHRFDASTYFECKGIGGSGQGIMYRGRWEKDKRFINDGNRIIYWFWRHAATPMRCYTIGDLRRMLAEKTISVAAVEREDLAKVIASRPLRPINSKYNKNGKRNGYGDPELYGSGWVFPISAIQRLCKYRSDAWAMAFGMPTAFELLASSQLIAGYIRRGHGATLCERMSTKA